MQTTAWQQQAALNSTAPKELGYMDRLKGLSSGLDELRGRLAAFAGRMSGDGDAKDSAAAPMPPGMHPPLSSAEQNLRECLAIVGRLNDLF